MDLTPNHKLRDYVRIDRFQDPFRRVATFPEILKSEHGAYLGIVTLDGRSVPDPMVAFLIDLIKWGYEKLEGHGELKEPRTDETMGLPNARALPYEMLQNPLLRLTRPFDTFFEFRKELPPGVKWTLKNEKKMVLSRTRFHYPTLCVGPRGYRSTAGESASGFETACLAAITMGHMLHNWDNGIHNLEVDDTSERLAWLNGRMSAPDFPKIVEDTKWDRTGGIARRGINDFTRIVKFDRKLEFEHLEVFKEFLSLDKCPGWTGIWSGEKDGAYVFTTTWDSSD